MLCDGDVDIVHELILRARIFPNNASFLDEMNLDATWFDEALKCKGVANPLNCKESNQKQV